MKSRLRRALAVSTVVASAALLGSGAYAQQQQTQTPAPAPQKSTPAASPAQGQNTASSSAAPQSNARRAPGASQGRALAMLSRMSPQDRAAILDARLAAVKAGLELTADQVKLWTPLEQTVRDGVNKAIALRQKYANQQPPADPMQRLSRMSEMASARADFLHRFLDSAQPLYASLTPEQKRRLPMLMHMMGGRGSDWTQPNGREGLMGERMGERMRQRMWERGGENGQRMHEGWRGNRWRRPDWRGGDQGDWRRGDSAPQNNNSFGDGGQ